MSLEGGVLTQRWRFVPAKTQKCYLDVMPVLALGPAGFGLHPTVRIGLKAGGWREVELGRLNTFWYQCDTLNLTGFNGEIQLRAEDGRHTLALSMDSERIGTISYMYDRYDFKLKAASRVLELHVLSQTQETPAGTPYEFALKLKLVKN